MTVVVESLTLASIYILFAVGLSLAWGVGKVLNLAHGAVFTAAGFVVYELTRQSAEPLWLLVICAAAGGAALTFVLDFCFFRVIRQRGGVGNRAELGQMVASLGAGVAIVAIAQNESGETTLPLPAGISTTRSFVFLGARVQLIDLVIILVAVAISLAVTIAVRRSRFGLALRGVAFDPGSCEILGINANGVTGATMALSGAMAGIAAALLSAETLAYNQQLGNSYILKGFAIVVLGGAGSVVGTVVGGLFLGFAEILTATYVSDNWVDSVAFVLIVLVLLIRPTGLFGSAKFARA
jgi:branched-chain amino acid transport system permease protein